MHTIFGAVALLGRRDPFESCRSSLEWQRAAALLIGLLLTRVAQFSQAQNTTAVNATFACLQKRGVAFVADSTSTTYNNLRLGIANRAYQFIRPSAYVLCSTSGQVVAAVQCVYSTRVPFVIRSGGGASYALSTIQSGGVVIDVSGIDDFSLDRQASTARVGVGLRLGHLMYAIHSAGFVFPAGTCAVAGVSGFVLGSGFGPFERWLGLSGGTLLEADVVLANGTTLRATPSAHGDLLWALRGGGGNFAAVTHLKVALTKAPPTITSLELRWPTTYSIMRKLLRSFICAKPWTWSSNYASVRLYKYSTYLRVTIYYVGPKADVQKLIRANPCRMFTDAGPYNVTIFDEIPPTNAWLRHGERGWNLSDLQNASFVDAQYVAGNGKWHHWGNSVTFSVDNPPNGTLLDRIVAHAMDPNANAGVRVDAMGGAVAAGVPGRPLAWPGQNVAALLTFGTGLRKNFNQLQLPPLKRILNEVWPQSNRLAHINYMGPHPDAQPDPWKLYYGGNSVELLAVKKRYDPGNRFRGLDLPHQVL